MAMTKLTQTQAEAIADALGGQAECHPEHGWRVVQRNKNWESVVVIDGDGVYRYENDSDYRANEETRCITFPTPEHYGMNKE